MTSQFKIDFVGIGASKSGTTWLGQMLAQHPQVCMSMPKEVYYFNETHGFRSGTNKPGYAHGLAWYAKFFSHCAADAIKGEITPLYSTDTQAAERIFQHNPEVKIFYCLRNPFDRIESQYNFAKHFVKIERREMLKALQEEPEYLEMSRYFKNLSKYLQYFSKEQIFIVWFEDIKTQPEALLKEVFSFLGVDPSFIPEKVKEKSNPGRVSRMPGLERFVRNINHKLSSVGFSTIVGWMKRSRPWQWAVRMNNKPLQKERLTAEARAYILNELRADIESLEKWSGKDLEDWLKS